MTRIETVVEILDRSLDKIAEAKALYPINEQGTVLRYSKELSDFGTCVFRLRPQDPIFEQYGDIIEPHKYHIRIKRGGVYVWQGAIVDNPRRTHNFIEVKAAEYEFYFGKKLIKRTSAVSYGSTAPSEDIGLHFRIFSSGTMATAITDIVTEARDAFGADHVLGSMEIGTIENPDYPKNASTSSGAMLTGEWNFSSDLVLQYDYQSVLYALKAFGIYSNADFRVYYDSDGILKFEFKKFMGNKNNGLVLTYGPQGNVVDYDIPRLGSRMSNTLVGISTDPRGVILHAEKSDSASVQDYGLLEEPAAFADVKDKNGLNSRLAEQLRLTGRPDAAPLNFLLNEKSYPLGRFDLGDIVTGRIIDGAINYKAPRRIAGYTVSLHNTGRELVTVQTNRPRDEDIGGA
jgi:hypothetical protein